MKNKAFCRKKTFKASGCLIDLSEPKVMGILNITPDSFFDGGRYNSEKQIIEKVKQMLNEGADIIDIGASSTRPGAQSLNSREEIERLTLGLKIIKKEFPKAIISVDTYQCKVAKAAVEMGAHIINDISGGTLDKNMPKTMGHLKVPYVLVHIQGTPQDMQKNPAYNDVVKDVTLFFSKQLEKFLEQGLNDIILDPGFGFGKKLKHNYQLLAQLSHFKLFDRSLLVGVSRKSMINKILSTSPKTALNGTTALHMLTLERGANILRVHDVKEACEAIKIFTFTQNFV